MGGTTRRNAKGELAPAFPNARLWLQRQNWEWAWKPSEKDRASYLTENFDLYRNDSKLQLVDTQYGSREEILPGIFVRVSNGHTGGLQMVEVADDSHSLIYCADAVPTATHVKIPFIMGYDCQPLVMMDEKRKLLSEAVDRGTILFFEHCPRAEAATVYHDGKDFAVKQAWSFA
jgi:glyoxylase-like metal-dependent hydrolase (beta-lactamase superfamily II)